MRMVRERTWMEVLAASAGVALLLVLLLVLGVKTATHVIAPRLLTHYEHFPAMASAPKRTIAPDGRAADPVNVAIVGSAAELEAAMRAAGWVVADSLGWEARRSTRAQD